MKGNARFTSACVTAFALVTQACELTATDQASETPVKDHTLELTAARAADAWHRPGLQTKWQIQLSGALDTSVSAELFDVDLFDTSAEQIAALQARGSRVICYFDTAYEPWRPDAFQLEPFRGAPLEGWPGQYWLDIRATEVMEVMQRRIALARSKGCDGVDADDIDAVDNDPGFPITRREQQLFVIKLANGAHGRGLSFGLKNALNDIPALLSFVDFAVNEECFAYRECEQLRPFIEAGKPVFNIEYADALAEKAAEICPRATTLGFRTLIKHLDLGPERHECP